jgi:hypothetical protein
MNELTLMKRVTEWSKAVRDAMLKGGAEFQRQKVLNRAVGNCSKEFLRTTDIGSARIRQVTVSNLYRNQMQLNG